MIEPTLHLPGSFKLPGRSLKPGWQVYRFDQIASNVNDRIEPGDTDAEYYIGLEHLDSDSLKIRRWGQPSEVEATKLRFCKGDIIFGRRRAYQRKLGVAEFDGICSAHAMVLRPKTEVVLPEFLPFFMQSDLFMNRALEISVGSLSPTINWRTLAEQEFALPTLVEQRRLAEVLMAIETESKCIQEAIVSLSQCRKAYLEEIFYPESSDSKPLNQIANIMSGGTPSRNRSDYWNGNIPWLSPKDMKLPIISNTTEHITETAVEAGTKVAPPETIFIVVRGMILAHTFPVCRSTVPMAFNQDVRGIVVSDDFLPTFLQAWFDWAGPRYLTLVSNSSHGTKRLETELLLRLRVPCFSMAEQEEILKPLRKTDIASDGLHERQNGLAILKKNVLAR